MFRKPFAALALVAALLPAAASAQTVDEIIAKHFEAQGGIAKLQKLQTVRMVGKMQMGPGMEAPFTMEKKRPGKSRITFTFSGMDGVRAFDGKTGWQVMPFMSGKKDAEPMSPEDTKDMEEQADFDGPLMNAKDKGNTLELAGKEAVDGADAYKVKLTHKDGKVDWYFFDAETYLLVKQEMKRKVRGTEMEFETFPSDYKEVGDGLLMPFSISQGAKGNDHRQAMTFDKIEVDVPLDDAIFVMPAPAGGAAPDAKAAPAKDAKPAAKTAPTKDK